MTKEITFKKPEWLRKKLTPHTQVEMENLLKDVGGQKDTNNGLLLIVATEEKKLRIIT